jgi:hypothetical protein
MIAAQGSGQHRLKLARFQTVRRLLASKTTRRSLHAHFLASGGNEREWTAVLHTRVPDESLAKFSAWTPEEWNNYISTRALEAANSRPPAAAEVQGVIDLTAAPLLDAPPVAASGDRGWVPAAEDVARARELLPPGPWTNGVHKEVARKLGVSEYRAWRILGAVRTAAGGLAPVPPAGGSTGVEPLISAE